MVTPSILKLIQSQIDYDKEWLLNNITMLFEMSKENIKIGEILFDCFPMITPFNDLDLCMNIFQLKKILNENNLLINKK